VADYLGNYAEDSLRFRKQRAGAIDAQLCDFSQLHLVPQRPTNRASDAKPSEERSTPHAVLIFAVGMALYVLLGLGLWWILDYDVNPSAIKRSFQNPPSKSLF
jgi:hypothetical protein